MSIFVFIENIVFILILYEFLFSLVNNINNFIVNATDIYNIR